MNDLQKQYKTTFYAMSLVANVTFSRRVSFMYDEIDLDPTDIFFDNYKSVLESHKLAITTCWYNYGD